MLRRTPTTLLCGAALAAALVAASRPSAQTPAPPPPASQDPPRILYQASPRAVEYQLGRLTNGELSRVERNETDPKFRPVYVALLTRKGIGREYFDEAIEALIKIDKASRTRVLLDGLAKVKADDDETADKLARVVLAQPAAVLRKERDLFAKAIDAAAATKALRAAYGALMIADNSPQPAWDTAAKREGHLVELVRSVPLLGDAQELRASLFGPVSALAASTQDPAARAAAVYALGWTRADQATFTLLAAEVIKERDAASRSAAIRSLQQLPREAWPAGEVEPLARALVALVKATATEKRADPVTIEATQLGEKLADALPDDPRRAIRRDLRALGVQVVRIEALPEKMMFDLRWFVVEAGKLVQIVLFNPDVMSHNLLLVKPGSLQEIGMAASTMALSPDPNAKQYVPNSPLVLQSTRLINWGETERLGFAAPKDPGEYPYVCTYPGHWVRMYGVMLVVNDLEQWEANRTVPTDPMTKKPFAAQRN